MYTPKHLAEKILTSKAALEGERKQVTVLFADLKGSMELLADRDPEEARQLLDPVLERMMEAVHRYEGTVNQVMGDGIMALFGAPVAHEDHAVRACYAALDMQRAIGRYAEEVRRSHGISLQIRAGLNSGEVVVRTIGSDLRMDYTAVGETTHLAARMEHLAAPGSTLLTADTLRLAEGWVEVRPLGPVPVKGLQAPVEVFEILRAGPRRSRLHAAAVRGLSRFVGRDSELEQVRLALGRAATGRGQVVAVVGEAGVGKSRLVWEVTHSHRAHGWLILEGRSVSYGKASPWLPVIELLKGYAGIGDRDEPRAVREKVTGKLLTLEDAFKPTLPAFLSLLDIPAEDPQWQALDPPERRQRTLDAIKRLVLRETHVQPVLAVFEDLHWIDSETQALLDSLVESVPAARLLLLVNYRPEYQHGWGGKTYYSQIRLDPLTPESVGELLQATLGGDDSLQSLTAWLVERTEGNPLFLEETVRTLVETGVVAGERGAYRLVRSLHDIQVPATVQAILASRIDRLGTDDKGLLQAASVIGKDVPVPLLLAIAGLPDAELRQGLARLQAAEFVYETSVFPDSEYTFRHALTHEAAYQSLLKSSRQQHHQRIAHVLEEEFPDTAVTRPDVLAHHYTQAGLATSALPYWLAAGKRAAERSAHAEAIDHLTRGLELFKSLPDAVERPHQELEFQTSLGPALAATRGYAAPEVTQTYGRARELCKVIGDTPKLFPALWGLWESYLVRAELQTARELGDQLLDLAQLTQDPALLLEAHDALGVTFQLLGAVVPARTHLERGITLYRVEHHRGMAQLYGQEDPGTTCRAFLAMSLWLLGYPAQALERMHEAFALAHELSHPLSLAQLLTHAAFFHHFRGEPATVQQHAEAAITLCSERGFAYYLACATIMRGWALVTEGQGEEGIDQMLRGIDAIQATGGSLRQPYYLAMLAEAYWLCGWAERGVELLARARAASHRSGGSFWEAEVHRLEGELLLCCSGDDTHIEAESRFESATEIARRQEAKSLELRASMSLCRLWKRQGKEAAARERLAHILGWFTEGFDAADLKEAKALLDL